MLTRRLRMRLQHPIFQVSRYKDIRDTMVCGCSGRRCIYFKNVNPLLVIYGMCFTQIMFISSVRIVTLTKQVLR